MPHLDAAYRFARWLTRSPTEADDIVQEAFLRAFRSLESLRSADARAWLLTIVRNCHVTARRNASWTISSASVGERVSQRAKR